MAVQNAVAPVKWFVAILWHDASVLTTVLSALEVTWGELDFVGGDHSFDVTDYYADEMGLGLRRRLVSFRRLGPPEQLVGAKLRCNKIETQLAVSGRRTANLDIGYLDHNKLVLGSVKYAGQKIHLGEGVYADLVARFKGGRYQPFEWTFPDFRDGRYDAELLMIREKYLAQLREWRSAPEMDT